MNKFRAGAALGLVAGVSLGIAAQRRRAALQRAATTVGRARAVVDLTRFRVHDAVEHSPVAQAR
jgi:hypothetical protein